MTEHDLDALVARTARISDAAVGDLPLGPGAADLREALMSVDPVTTAPEPATTAGPRGRRDRRTLRRQSGSGAPRLSRARRSIAIVALVACVVVGVVLSGVVRGGPAGDGTAWAAPLVRFAESSPLLLLDEPGWSVTRADELDEDDGEMTFAAGERTADLHWRGGSLEEWQRDRAHDADVVETHEVLGQPAQVTSYSDREFTALWRRDGQVLEFRSAAGGDLAGFLRLLARLTPVDIDGWLEAMPASVVRASGRTDAVRGMLEGVPVPPGLDLGRLERGTLLKDRYQLGAQVTRLVACRWSKVWRERTRRGDAAGAAEAVRAMATADRWPILVEMDRSGDWPTIIRGIAPAMRRDDTPSLRAATARDVTPEFCGVAFPQR